MDDAVVDQRKKYTDNLYKQLEKAVLASEFGQTPTGKYVLEILESDVNRFIAEISSDKYVKDHDGYLDARAKLSYASSLLGRLNRTANPKTEEDLREKIKEAEADG